MAKRILILGAQGMLGAQLARLYPLSIAWDKDDADVLNAARFEIQLRAVAPRLDAVVNCVAFNDVDGAEDRPEDRHDYAHHRPWRRGATPEPVDHQTPLQAGEHHRNRRRRVRGR